MITPQQLAKKKEQPWIIGGSEIANILGYGRLSPYDQWLVSMGRVDLPQRRDKSIEAGDLFERPLMEWLARTLGRRVSAKNTERTNQSLKLRVHVDAFLLGDTPAPVEAKTRLFFHSDAERWGPEGSGEVPEYVICQVYGAFLCDERFEEAFPVAGLRNRGPVWFRVERRADLIDYFGSALDRWNAVNIQGDTPPEGTPSLDVARYMRRTSGKRTTIRLRTVDQWTACNARLAEEQALADEAKAALLTEVGDAEVAEFDGGEIVLKGHTQRRFNVDRFRKEHPELAQEYTEESPVAAAPRLKRF